MSVGTLSGLNVNGNETVTGYLNVVGNILTSTLNAAQINTTGNVIAQSGIFNNVVINSGNINLNNGYFIGNGSQLTGLPAGYSNVQVATYLSSGLDSSPINTTGNISGATIIAGTITTTGTLTAALVNSSGNILATNFVGSGALLTSLPGYAYSNVNIAAYTQTMGYTNYSNVNTAAYLSTTGYALNSGLSLYAWNANVTNYSNVNTAAYLSTNNYLTISTANLSLYAWNANVTNYSNVNTAAYTQTMGYTNYSNVNVAAYSQTQGYSNYSNVNTAAYTQTMGYTNYSNVNTAAYTQTMGYTNYSNVNVAAYLPGYTGTLSASLVNSSGNLLAVTANVTQLGATGNILVGGMLNATGNILGSTATFSSGYFNSTTNATGINSGAVQLNGGMSIGRDLWVAGNVYAGNLVSVSTQVLTIQDSLLYLQNSNVYPYTYSIGLYGHYIGGPANTYVHSAITRQPNDNSWWFLSNISEPNPVTGNINVYDANRILDSINTGGHNAYGNITVLNNYSLNVNPPMVSFSNAPINATWNANSYTQINIQNTSSVGTQASADFIATAPDGSDGSKYIDMGINGNNWVSSAWTVSGADDGYLYVNSGQLTVGTDTAGKDLILHTGGTLASSIKARFYDTAGNLTVFTPLYTTSYINTTANISTAQLNAGQINTTGNVLSTGAVHNSLTVNGVINASGNILAGFGVFNGLTTNNGLTVNGGWINNAGNIVATGGIFNALTVNGLITQGVTTANTATAILTHGSDPSFQLTAQNGYNNSTGSEVTRFGINYSGTGWDSFTQYIRGSAAQNGYQSLWAANAPIANITSTGLTVTGIINATGNILSTGAVHNTLTVNGTASTNVASVASTILAGAVGVTGNIIANASVIFGNTSGGYGVRQFFNPVTNSLDTVFG